MSEGIDDKERNFHTITAKREKLMNQETHTHLFMQSIIKRLIHISSQANTTVPN